MMTWSILLDLGDLDVTVPAAAALATWLTITRAWRAALWWSGLFALGIGLVGATKIAFLGWGTGLPSLDFKAVSGHATGVTAVLPTAFYAMWQARGHIARAAGVTAGLALGLAMVMLLVQLQKHTMAEALAGWTMGALVSLGAIRMAGDTPPSETVPGLLYCNLLCCFLVFMLAAWMMQSASVGYWMIRVALLLSGNRSPRAWDA